VSEIRINRAPFLTLWASVVARRLGYDEEASLSLGRAVAGLTAQSKGRRLGIFTPSSAEARAKLRSERDAIGATSVEMMDRVIPCVKTQDGLRALSKAAPIDPASVRKYLSGRFKESLPDVERKLVALAETFTRDELDDAAMDVYMRLRPNVPKGRDGWGKNGTPRHGDDRSADRVASRPVGGPSTPRDPVERSSASDGTEHVRLLDECLEERTRRRGPADVLVDPQPVGTAEPIGVGEQEERQSPIGHLDDQGRRAVPVPVVPDVAKPSPLLDEPPISVWERSPAR